MMRLLDLLALELSSARAHLRAATKSAWKAWGAL